MSNSDLLARLANHRTLGSVPQHELEWLAAHGELRRYSSDTVIGRKGDERLTEMYIILSGRMAIWRDRGSGRYKAAEWGAGDVTGRLPFSRMTAMTSDAIIEESTEALVIHEDDLPELVRNCLETTSALVHILVDRARLFTSNDLHNEKMMSLGRLSAGLAHELNNPAAAVARSAQQMGSQLNAAESASETLGATGFDADKREMLRHMRDVCLASPSNVVLSPIEQAEREDEIADWLDDHGADAALAESLADTAATIETLEKIAASFAGNELDIALAWIASGCSVRGLAREIERSACRISDLVTAIKGFTHMDQSTTAEPMEIGPGIVSTLAVLRAKARSKSVGITVDAAEDLPKVNGFGGELNQVWSNLIENAIDAVDESGRIEVTARQDGPNVVVRVIDNGPGIPEEVLDRIFDPFFTTKPVGQGTGLGLDITRRLVQRHDGHITVESAPGRTEFAVSLPGAGGKPGSTEAGKPGG